MQTQKIDARFSEHLGLFRKTLLCVLLTIGLAVALCFCFYESLFAFLLLPFKAWEIPFIFLSPFDGFFLTLKVALVSGIVFSSPIWSFFLLQFFLPALKEKEQKGLWLFLGLSTFFITCGVMLAYLVTLPAVLGFFTKFNEKIGENLWTLKDAVGSVLWILASHVIAFEAVALLWAVILSGLVPISTLKKARPWAILSIAVLAAILTPPDVISQLCLALPLYFFFELSILFASFFSKHKARD